MANEIVKINLQGTPSEIKAQEKALQKIVNLSADHRNLLLEIAENPKYLKALADNSAMLKTMI